MPPPPVPSPRIPEYLNFSVASSFKAIAKILLTVTGVLLVLILAGYFTGKISLIEYLGSNPTTTPFTATSLLFLTLIASFDHVKYYSRVKTVQNIVLFIVGFMALILSIFIITDFPPTSLDSFFIPTNYPIYGRDILSIRPTLEVTVFITLLSATIYAAHITTSSKPYVFLSLVSIAVTITSILSRLVILTSAAQTKSTIITPYSTLILQVLLLSAIIFSFPTKGILRFFTTPTPSSKITQRILILCIAIPLAALATTITLYFLPEAQLTISLLLIIEVLIITFFLYILFNALEQMDSARLKALELASRSIESMDSHAPLVQLLRQELTPEVRPRYNGIDAFLHSRPASGHLSGDWLTLTPLSDTLKCFILIDVSGHGADAALFALRIKYELLTSLRSGMGPSTALASTIPSFDDQPDRLTTAVVATFNMETFVCTYATAGHLPVFQITGKSLTKYPHTSPALGIPNCTPQEVTFNFTPGDMIIFYTDGLVEARSPNGEFFTIERLQKIFEENSHQDPESILETTMSQAWSFAGENFQDDATIAIIQVRV